MGVWGVGGRHTYLGALPHGAVDGEDHVVRRHRQSDELLVRHLDAYIRQLRRAVRVASLQARAATTPREEAPRTRAVCGVRCALHGRLLYVRVRVCACARVRVCVRACVRVCVRVGMAVLPRRTLRRTMSYTRGGSW